MLQLTAMILERLEPASLGELAAALDAAGLRNHDLAEPGCRFYRLEGAAGVGGYAGLELYGSDALLRSVVAPKQGCGFGRHVVEATLNEARRLGVKRLWLLTETAERFFEHMGFTRADRATAPAAIAATEQFSSLCPASATFMKREL